MPTVEMMEDQTLGDYLEQTCSQFLNNSAYFCNNRTLSFDQLEKKSRRLAHWFQTVAKLDEGDRVAIQLPNINEYPIVVFAALRVGLVVVNTNPLYTTREMKHQFNDSGVKAIVILDELSPKLSEIIEETEIKNVITVCVNDFYDFNNDNEKYAYLYPVTTLVDIINGYLPENLISPQTKPSDIAIIQYTGGTTGVSKGACLTHKNILSNVDQINDRLKQRRVIGKDIFVCPLPLYHIYAFTINMMYVAGTGGLNLLIKKPQDVNEFLNAMKKHAFTSFVGINSLFVSLCADSRFRELDFSHLKLTMSGGATLTSSVVDIWRETTGIVITEAYGLSETSPVATYNIPGKEEIGTVGQAVINTDVHIIDPDDNRLPSGQEGEIIIRGPQVMKGYWQSPVETKNAFTSDGFFKTGDIGVIQPSGAIKIVDRIKDMILVSGFNVYPNEIENILTNNDAVMEAAVIGKPCIKTGESVWAYITISKDITIDEITSYCKEFLTPYKVPKHILIVDSLPKSTVGKILRRELRDTQK